MIRYCITAAVMASLASLSHSASVDSDYICSLPKNIEANPSNEKWHQLALSLPYLFDSCLSDSQFFALYGAALLNTGNTVKALEMLERALLINPENGSARIDYAQALYQSGHIISAIQLNQSLIEDTDTPTKILSFLKMRQGIWKSKTHSSKNQVSYLYGHSNNLNNATYLKELNLSISGQRFSAVLAPNSRSISGNYHYLGAQSNHHFLESDGSKSLNFTLKSRESNDNKSDTDEFSLSYKKESEKLLFNSLWEFGIEHLRYDDKGLYTAANGSWRYSPKLEQNFYLDLSSRIVNFINQNDLDEYSITLRPGFILQSDTQRFGVELGFGVNNELDTRLGGDRINKEFSIFHDYNFLNGQLSTRISYFDTLDKEAYSPLFENLARRKTESVTASLQYFYPINNRIVLHTSYYYRYQKSNIDLFETNTENFDLGITYRF